VVSQCKNWCLAEGLRKRRSALLYRPWGSERTLLYFTCFSGWCAGFDKPSYSIFWYLHGWLVADGYSTSQYV